MERADSGFAEVSLEDLWFGLARRIGVLLGAATALVSLVFDAPLGTATARGGAVFFLAWALGKGGYAALARTWSPPPEPPESPEEPEGPETDEAGGEA